MKIKYWPVVIAILTLPWLAWALTSSEQGSRYGSKGATSEMLATDAAAMLEGGTTTIYAHWSSDVDDTPDCAGYSGDGSDYVGFVSGDDYRTAQRFSVSGIPSTWTVTGVSINVKKSSNTGSPGYLQFNRYGSDDGDDNPETDCGANAQTFFDNCSGVSYASVAEPGADAYIGMTELNATAIADLNSCISDSDDWWSVGMETPDAVGANNVVEFDEFNEAGLAYIMVEYSYPAP